MNAELLSYSRNKGIFAGIDLDGTSVSQNVDDTDVYFGAPHHFETILKGEVPCLRALCRLCARWPTTLSLQRIAGSRETDPSGIGGGQAGA